MREKNNAKHVVIIANKKIVCVCVWWVVVVPLAQFILSVRLENTHAIAASICFLRFRFTQPVGQIDLVLARWAQHNLCVKAFHVYNVTCVKLFIRCKNKNKKQV